MVISMVFFSAPMVRLKNGGRFMLIDVNGDLPYGLNEFFKLEF
jgi:hypothetical protein